jgi:hypothetical protein
MIYPLLRNHRFYWVRDGYAWQSLGVLLRDLREVRRELQQ